jgi:hypothetical protein
VNIRLRSVVASQVGATSGSFQPPQSSELSDIATGLCVTHGNLVSV